MVNHYQTDDQYPTVTLTSTTCTTLGIHAQVLSVVPSACTGNAIGTNNQATVEVWGDSTCTQLSNVGSSATIAGKYDGFTSLIPAHRSREREMGMDQVLGQDRALLLRSDFNKLPPQRAHSQFAIPN